MRGVILTKSQKCNVIHEIIELFMDNDLTDPDLSPGMKRINANLDLMVT